MSHFTHGPIYLLLKEPRSCILHLDRGGLPFGVALGRVHPSPDGTVIHHKPLPPDHVKVMVDAAFGGEDDTPLPVPNGELNVIRDAVGSFTAWPKNMVFLDDAEVTFYIITDSLM